MLLDATCKTYILSWRVHSLDPGSRPQQDQEARLCAVRRFKHNPYVNGDPPVRFYCGTPLIASNGHRLGTLCFADHEAHTFDAERCNILNNMAELCVREIERDFVIRRQSMESTEHLVITQSFSNFLRY